MQKQYRAEPRNRTRSITPISMKRAYRTCSRPPIRPKRTPWTRSSPSAILFSPKTTSQYCS